MKRTPKTIRNLFLATLFIVALILFTGWSFIVARRANLAGIHTNSQAISNALKNDPNDPAAHKGLALQYTLKHDFSAAINEYQKVLQVHPDDRETLFLLGSAYERSGKIREAREVYLNLLKINDDVAASAQKRLDKIPLKEIKMP